MKQKIDDFQTRQAYEEMKKNHKGRRGFGLRFDCGGLPLFETFFFGYSSNNSRPMKCVASLVTCVMMSMRCQFHCPTGALTVHYWTVSARQEDMTTGFNAQIS